MQNNLISIIVRFHDESKLYMLEDAIASIATQTYPHIQVIVSTQNIGDKGLKAIQKIIAGYFPENPNIHRIISNEAKEDARSALLNDGIGVAEGRYLAFLDYDDILYPQAYITLIERCKKSRKAIVVGGCNIGRQEFVGGRYITKSTDQYLTWQKGKFDLLMDNFIPIHSYIIDRRKVKKENLVFNEDLCRLEDYAFLLGLVSKYDFDFEHLLTPLCEYRWRTDGSNTVSVYDEDEVKKERWEKAEKVISELKERLTFTAPIAEISTILKTSKEKEVAAKRDADHFYSEMLYYKKEFEYYFARTKELQASLAFKIGIRIGNGLRRVFK